MEGKEHDKRVVMRCHGRDQDQVVLVEGKKKHMHHVGFGTKPEDLASLKKRLEQNGTKLVDAPKETPYDGVWFRDPDGLLVNVRAAERRSGAPFRSGRSIIPATSTGRASPAIPKRDIRCARRAWATRCASRPRWRKWWTSTRASWACSSPTARRTSSRSCAGRGAATIIFFGYIKSDRPGFHHRELRGRQRRRDRHGRVQAARQGYKDGWGFGRHVIGSNFFHYIRDPWDSMAEYFCDIDYIPADSNWKATNYPRKTLSTFGVPSPRRPLA